MIRVGVPNFSLDLISGLPHQTLERWQATLAAGVAIAPLIFLFTTSKSSSYCLWSLLSTDVQPPTDDTTVQMYRQGRQI